MNCILKYTAIFFLFIFSLNTFAFSRGIYITQSTAQNKTKMAYLISNAKKYHIDTFIIDVTSQSKGYAAAVKNVLQNGIHYVARIVIFPHGGTHAQVVDKSIWQKRLNLAKYAAGLGASAIQLDYIRYRSEYPASPEKAKYILKVVQYFKKEVSPVPLQIDIFGISTLRPAHTIGQDPASLAVAVNAFCPMVYPSHYEPFIFHSNHPYETVFNSVNSLKKILQNHPGVSIYAYIEIYNYRFHLSAASKSHYIKAEIKAAHDAGANGWYVWSATNHYAPLFQVLAMR